MLKIIGKKLDVDVIYSRAILWEPQHSLCSVGSNVPVSHDSMAVSPETEVTKFILYL